jgi:hypothetical protein
MAPKGSGAFASIAGDDPLDEAIEAARVLDRGTAQAWGTEDPTQPAGDVAAE